MQISTLYIENYLQNNVNSSEQNKAIHQIDNLFNNSDASSRKQFSYYILNSDLEMGILVSILNKETILKTDLFKNESIVFLISSGINDISLTGDNQDIIFQERNSSKDTILLFFTISKSKLFQYFIPNYIKSKHPSIYSKIFQNTTDFHIFDNSNDLFVNIFHQNIGITKVQPEVRQQYLEFSCVQFLNHILSINESENKQSITNSIRLQKEDIEKLAKLEKIIKLSFSKMPSICELSKKINLNEFKLKNGFKQIYGIPPYQYFLNYRLEIAYKMIYQEGKSVAEVTDLIGYESNSKFAKAFKKKYGFPPNQFKRNRK